MRLENITIGQVLLQRLKTMADENAFEYRDAFYTWRDLDELSDVFAVKLLKCGIKYDTHVAIWGGNTPNWIITYVALAKIGAVSVLINPRYKEEELAKTFEYSDVEYVCYGDCCSNSKNIIDHLNDRNIGKVKEYMYMGKNEHYREGRAQILKNLNPSDMENLRKAENKVTPQHIASIVFTSGTTSFPKGVMLTHYQLVNISREAVEQMKWETGDRMCMSVPLFHCFGLSTGFLASLRVGFCIYLLPELHTSCILKCIHKYKITILNGVPTIFLALLSNPERREYDLSSLKSGIIAGSKVFKEDYLKICKELKFKKLQQSYGQTETSPCVTFNGYDDLMNIKCISVGKVIPNVKIKIVSTKDGHDLGPYEAGEILVKGFNIMKGYYKCTRQNCEKVKDGWLYTGDIGYVDNCENLYITGRKKDIIIRSGENISPVEIEEAILRYPGVLQVKVFGIPVPVVQEEIAACIVAENGKLDVDGLVRYLKKHIADYKVPKYIYIFKKFPMNLNGKVNVKQLKKEVQWKVSKEEDYDFNRTASTD